MPGSPYFNPNDHARMLDHVRAVRDGIDRIRVTTYSPDGLVRVVCGGRGQLLELELDPRVYRELDSSALADTIRETIRESAEDAEHSAAKVAEKLLPEHARSTADRGGDDIEDPRFGPVLNMLDAERKKGERRWQA
jgi:DNA-binding protein YbaB